MELKTVTSALLLSSALLLTGTASADSGASLQMLDRGRYLAAVAGCNDCHTPGYAESGGKVPQQDWLTGSPVGFKGPWGTTYPANLRLLVQSLSESEWMTRARSPMRPPMPWFALRDMNDNDLLAIYRFLRHLGAKGEPAPRYVEPAQAVNTPYIDFVPKNLPTQARSD
jgi:mono/diheme cytochrome c family protein